MVGQKIGLRRAGVRVRKLWLMVITTALIILIGFIPVRLAITLNQVPEPQAILVLGGNTIRMTFAVELWRSHPTLEIWVSDWREYYGGNSSIFRQAGVPDKQIHYDICATDTVTNFTCTVEDFANRNIRHLYLITSDYHIERAQAIATLVLGSRGIVVTPVSVNTPGFPPESPLKTLRDCFRSILWIVTGRTGASLNPNLLSRSGG